MEGPVPDVTEVPAAAGVDAPHPASSARIFTWANRVTFTRILLIPVFVWAVLETPENPHCRWLALGLFALMSLGDLLDGFLARRLGERTALGAFLDPAADKLLMTTSTVLLATHLWPEPRLPLFAAVAIVSRDLFLVFGFCLLYLLKAEVRIEVKRLGKATTFVQMGMVLCVLVGLSPAVILAASWIAVAFTIVSGFDYFRTEKRRLG